MPTKTNTLYRKVPVVLALVSLHAGVCTAQADESFGRASIQPTVITLDAGERTKFTVMYKATTRRPSVLSSARVAQKVQWSVNGVEGGSAEYGTIEQDGSYTAPRVWPAQRDIPIVGKVNGVQNEILFASVTKSSREPCYESVFTYSERRAESEYFDHPHDITLDLNGDLLIVDERKHHAMRFTSTGEFIGYLGDGPGELDRQFTRPRIVLVDRVSGDIFISDQKPVGNRIQVFTHAGEYKGSFGPMGHEPGMFLRIHGMDFDDSGNLVVVDVDNARVTTLSREGNYIKSWGARGNYPAQLNEPHGLFVDRNGDIFVSSYFGTIKKFNRNGNYLLSFAHPDPPHGSMYIHTIAGDKWGNVYSMVRGIGGFGGQYEMNRPGLYSVEKFNNNGDLICGLNLGRASHSELAAFVDDVTGYVYVVFTDADEAGFEVFAPR